MIERTAATVLLSGGIDSAACAHHLLAQGFEVDALFVDYGQAARQPELAASELVAKELRIALRRVALSGMPTRAAGELPGRNAWLASTAYFAGAGRPAVIGLGVHAGTPYYDCSSRFWTSMSDLIAEQSDGTTRIVTPFLEWSKSDVYDYFVSNVNIAPSITYSCEVGTVPRCGKCLSCRDRDALGC